MLRQNRDGARIVSETQLPFLPNLNVYVLLERWYRHIKITDPSIYPRTLTINFFHAEAQYLPYLVEHHVLLVRNIKVHIFRLSFSTSS
jgi:hypothetical protein